MKTKRCRPTFLTVFHLTEIPWRQIMPTFLAITLPVITCVALLVASHVKETKHHNLNLVMHEQDTHMDLAENLLRQELQRMSRDILVFNSAPGVQRLCTNPQDHATWQQVNTGLSNFVRNRVDYNQARVLDIHGRELARVEKIDESTVIIPMAELETTPVNGFLHGARQSLLDGRTVLSPVELARNQQGEPVHPLHPVLQLAAPIVDQDKRYAGIVDLTYQGQKLIDLVTYSIKHHQSHEQHVVVGRIEIITQDGYWLLAKDREDEWGMLRDPQRSFDRRFPEMWKTMREQGHGQLQTADGLFTFTTLPLIAGEHSAGTSGNVLPKKPVTGAGLETTPFWLLVSQISPEQLAHINSQTKRFHLILFLVILLVAMPVALFVTLLLHRQKEDKTELQAQEQRFRLLYDKAPLPYQSLDPQGLLLNINQAWLATLGYSRKEVTGRQFSDFVTPLSLSHFQDSYSLFMEKGVMEDCELELIKKDGSTLLAAFHGESNKDAQGSLDQTHCIFTDITELQAEKQRANHLSLLLQTIIQLHKIIDKEREEQALIEHCCEILVSSRGYASVWIILVDANGKTKNTTSSGLLHSLNQLAQQINEGTPPNCILECRKGHKIVTIDTPALFCGKNCSVAKGYPKQGVMCATLEHNSTLYGYLNVSLPQNFIKDHEEKNRFGEIARDIGYALFNLDQQQKKIQAESSLRLSEERLRGITESAQDAILMMDPQGAVSFWNPASEKIFGYSAEEALGKDLHDLLAPVRYLAAYREAFPEFLRSGHGNAIGKTLELAALRKDGHEIPVTLSLSALLQNGEWHAVGIVRDMTNHKLMEEQMLQSEKMSTIAGLAAGVAHEINTPLSAILQSIQVIHQSLSPDLTRNQELAGQCGIDLAKIQEYFEKREINFFMDGIRESAIKSGKIINNLLQFSRPKKGENSLEDMASLLDKSVELAKNDYTLRKKYDILNVEIVREYSPNLPRVSCVAMDIEQVFINLLKNAVQAMGDQDKPKPKARIILRTLLQQKMIRVEIEDNGPGIDMETRRHIFDPFFTTKDTGAGTGLGLSVSYTIIVSKHGGQLTVQTETGLGAKFIIDLPLNNERELAPPS